MITIARSVKLVSLILTGILLSLNVYVWRKIQKEIETDEKKTEYVRKSQEKPQSR